MRAGLHFNDLCLLYLIFLFVFDEQIKSVLIQLYAHPKDAVLDIACGKVSSMYLLESYYIFTILRIKDCRTRYNGDSDQQQRRKKFSFPARLICADFYEVMKFVWTSICMMMHHLIFAAVR
ncbi:hypothetical protein BHM03_00048804 [Ensete ventricosum]|nr:hypothetical protein BHM03_00048804 [Ensete ventricosum]